MARTKEAAAMIARRRARRASRYSVTQDDSWKKYRRCDICQELYLCNNHADRKIRIFKWHGIEICAYCKYHVIRRLNRLIDLGVVKYTKKHLKEQAKRANDL